MAVQASTFSPTSLKNLYGVIALGACKAAAEVDRTPEKAQEICSDALGFIGDEELLVLRLLRQFQQKPEANCFTKEHDHLMFISFFLPFVSGPLISVEDIELHKSVNRPGRSLGRRHSVDSTSLPRSVPQSAKSTTRHWWEKSSRVEKLVQSVLSDTAHTLKQPSRQRFSRPRRRSNRLTQAESSNFQIQREVQPLLALANKRASSSFALG